MNAMPCRPPERRRRFAVLLLLMLALAGCREAGWQTRSIDGFMPDLAFTLTNENGRRVQAGDYAGDVVLLFFGFSHCRKTCPATLGKLSAVLDGIGAPAEHARVLFVSIDPGRDTPARLAGYTDAFAPQVIGLTGSRDQLQALTRRYRAALSYGDGYPDGDYAVYHSAGVFVFDGDGEARLLFQPGDGIDAIRADLARLLEENNASA
jgi:protein SCO1/2